MEDRARTPQTPAGAAAVVVEAAARLGEEAAPGAGALWELAAALEALRDLSGARLTEPITLERLALLADRLVALVAGGEGQVREQARLAAFALLDLLRLPPVLRAINEARAVAPWMERMVALCDAADFTVGRLLRQRVVQYGARTLFKILGPGRGRRWSWLDVAAEVDRAARGLLALLGETAGKRVAILAENRPEMAFLDLACLATGVVDVMVPAGSTDRDVGYILRHARASAVVVSTEAQLQKVLQQRAQLEGLDHVIVMDELLPAPRGVLTLSQLKERASQVEKSRVRRLEEAVRSTDLASVMYTSGTTGVPKGIMFTQRNIVSKRFARALALPEIGDRDVFLCYLPLCHTFGRYLEMLGTIFWGAAYVFASGVAPRVLVEDMQRVKPTVFISIPQKWMQFHERIAGMVDVEEGSDAEILAATRAVTGGKLRFGLSAAGYLDPDVFRFFQRQGVELMSGFGMTEATGGITMTPPGQYRDNSIGKALPGIELRLEEDGELKVRGPYVTIGYLDPEEGGGGLEDGWLRTGDIMEADADGFLSIVDRKKEIYKNTRGQTIAPQRVENLFRDFEEVKRVFLVGDHRDFNTALIFPNLAFAGADLAGMSGAERHAYFRSHVASVNRFLAPFERITDFALVERDFEEARGELTKKGTPRRRQIEENFAAVIDEMYQQSDVRLDVLGLEVRVSRRLLQALGLTAQDFSVEQGDIQLRASGARLPVALLRARGAECEVAAGACRYWLDRPVVDLERLLTTPTFWLGNESLVGFASLDVSWRRRRPGLRRDIRWLGRERPVPDLARLRQQVDERAASQQLDVMDVHLAAMAIEGGKEKDALAGLRLLARALGDSGENLAEPARIVLRRAAAAKSSALRRRAFQILAPCERPAVFPETLQSYQPGLDQLLDRETISLLCERGLEDEKLAPFLEMVERVVARGDGAKPALDVAAAVALLKFLAAYGARHPTRFEVARLRIIQCEVLARSPRVRKEAGRLLYRLIDGFRAWLGEAQLIAVDPETGREYRWEDVVTIEEEADPEEAERILSAIKSTTLIGESVFLFSGGDVPRLKDIPPGGIWVSHVGREHGKSVYRVTVHTRHRDSCDFAVNLNRDLGPKAVSAELNWHVLTSEPRGRHSLVERLGGFWPEYGLWSEEYASLRTVERMVRHLARQRSDEGRRRLLQTWKHFVWNGLAAYFEFWERTGRTLVLGNPTPDNVIVPEYDYYTNTRIVSISDRRPFAGLMPLMAAHWAEFIVPIEEKHELLHGVAGRELIFSALLEIAGEAEGIGLLEGALAEPACAAEPEGFRGALGAFLEQVRREGFCPARLQFAIDRYHRWAALNPEAEAQAKASTLQTLHESYRLDEVAARCPEARARFFRKTVFAAAREPLASGLEGLIARLRERRVESDELVELVSALRAPDLLPDEDYFLTRLGFPHLRPEDAADFISSGGAGRAETDIVVTLEDDFGDVFRVRRPMNPKEVARLYRLFITYNMDPAFGPLDQFLIAVGERGNLLGGLYYEIDEGGETAQLEKIVVAERHRKAGVSTGLMNEFFHRMRGAGVKTITTGFFRPEYFYGFGFRIERKYAGLVKVL
ncbi:MAG: AMP-binding protein [Planctomycetes bacterium]|nr:AMP-binding protein [Planctomycetota bacterium]